MQMHNPNHYEILLFLGFGDRSEIAFDTPKRCGTQNSQIPVTVINSAKFMQSLCKCYAEFMQSLCKVYAKFMQGRNNLSPKNIKGRQHTLIFLGLLGEELVWELIIDGYPSDGIKPPAGLQGARARWAASGDAGRCGRDSGTLVHTCA